MIYSTVAFISSLFNVGFLGFAFPGCPIPVLRKAFGWMVLAPGNPLALAVNSLLRALRPGWGWETRMRSSASWSTFYLLSFNGIKVINSIKLVQSSLTPSLSLAVAWLKLHPQLQRAPADIGVLGGFRKSLGTTSLCC